MQKINTTNSLPNLRRPSQPAITPVLSHGGRVERPSHTQSPTDIGAQQAGDIGRPTPVSEEPGDARSPPQCHSPVSPNNVLPTAIPTTPDPAQQPVQRPVQPLPSPNLSHKSDPTVTTPRVGPVVAEVPQLQSLPPEGRQTASPRQPVNFLPQNISTSLGSPLVSPTTNSPVDHVMTAQANVQNTGSRDEHRDKRPRLAACNQPATNQATTTQQPMQQPMQQPAALPISGGPSENPAGNLPPLMNPPIDLSPQALSSCIPFLTSIMPFFKPHESIHICLLRDACMVQDLQFLALHQLFCMSTVLPKPLPGLGDLAKHGIKVTVDMMRLNSPLSNMFLHYFSAFPSSFEPLVAQNKNYAEAVQFIISWAPSVIRTWPMLATKVVLRNYPPLIDEIAGELGVYSKVMQFMFYTASAKTLTEHRPGLDAAWKAVFDKNYMYFHNREARLGIPSPIYIKQIQEENKTVVTLYERAATAYAQAAAANATTQPINPQQTTIHIPRAPSRYHTPASHQVRIPPITQQTRRAPAATQARPRTLPPPFQRRANLQPRMSTASPSMAPTAANSTPAQPYQSTTRAPVTVSTATFNNNTSHMVPQQVYAHPPAQQYTQLVSQPQQARLLPPPNSPALILANPTPYSSLHQLHLKVVNVSLAKSGSNEPGETLFHYVESFAISPTLLNWHQQLHTWPLTLPPEEFAKLPIQFKSRNSLHVTQGIIDGSKIYQLRCVRLTDAKPLTEERWVVADSFWPKAIYIHVNGQEHHIRRRFHFAKDLPVNITRSLKRGENEIKITILGGEEERKISIFAMAVEIIDTASRQRVRQAIQPISQSTSLDRIVKRLTNNTIDDDELCFIDDFITVPLIDPFMARVFVTPVRTVSCKHSECFDLDTFLNTRQSRTLKGPHGMAEDWKCPICNEDARPKCLIIDQFLAYVRDELIQRKQLDDATAIKVRADRSWDINMRQTSTKNAQDSSVKAGGSSTAMDNDASSSPTPTQAPPNVIELD
ncbi:MIZ zinc finger protein [Arthroderma uncinatum]|uniref:MIZ zinc finger protein n=1 Tax=Arthroderma uncinatum TaxID=74035 RepID=UPI00144AD461|nr:MIZ zinc finger protein [Arthroderma uncinatum]KAF3483884.1 MIZ zinc finger protein [Arthroderma uncinatum]